MQQMWAPWRLEFIKGPKPAGCFLCEAAAAPPAEDAAHLVVSRSTHSMALLNRYPYNNGHLMVAPQAHLDALDRLSAEQACDLMALTRRSLSALRSALSPDGFNLGVNQGKVAGAGVADHVHQHVVPRWNGDTNFMPVLAEVKVLNQHLDASYRAIRESFDNLA